MSTFIHLNAASSPEVLVKELISQTLSILATIVIEIPQIHEEEYEKTKYSIYKKIIAVTEVPDINNALASLLDTRRILLEWEKAFFIQDKYSCSSLSEIIAGCLGYVYEIKDLMRKKDL